MVGEVILLSFFFFLSLFFSSFCYFVVSNYLWREGQRTEEAEGPFGLSNYSSRDLVIGNSNSGTMEHCKAEYDMGAEG